MLVQEHQGRQNLFRARSFLGRFALLAGVPGAVLSALWITAGRTLFGAGGDLVPVFAVSFGPALLVVMLLAWWWMRQDARRYQEGAGSTSMMGYLSISTWLLAFIFGMLCPDRIDGHTVSAAANLLGGDFIGLSAGFGNTFGILTFVSAFAMFFVALGENRRSAKRLAGISEEDEERMAREQSEYDFLD